MCLVARQECGVTLDTPMGRMFGVVPIMLPFALLVIMMRRRCSTASTEQAGRCDVIACVLWVRCSTDKFGSVTSVYLL
jgi:hypothetical protein